MIIRIGKVCLQRVQHVRGTESVKSTAHIPGAETDVYRFIQRREETAGDPFVCC
jgi:hypothetical protein